MAVDQSLPKACEEKLDELYDAWKNCKPVVINDADFPGEDTEWYIEKIEMATGYTGGGLYDNKMYGGVVDIAIDLVRWERVRFWQSKAVLDYEGKLNVVSLAPPEPQYVIGDRAPRPFENGSPRGG